MMNILLILIWGPNCLQRLSADDKSHRWQGKSLQISITYNKQHAILASSLEMVLLALTLSFMNIHAKLHLLWIII